MLLLFLLFNDYLHLVEDFVILGVIFNSRKERRNVVTRFTIQAKGPDGKWTRKPLAYRESNNVHLLITRPPEICVNLVFKHIHVVRFSGVKGCRKGGKGMGGVFIEFRGGAGAWTQNSPQWLQIPLLGASYSTRLLCVGKMYCV